MNIIVVGLGKVGLALAAQLAQEDHNITVVDQNLAVVKTTIENLDVIGVSGNCTTVRILSEAGAASAELVIAVTNNDEINLLCCLLAKKLGAQHTIARVRNPEYVDELKLIKDDLGLSMAVNPEREAANEAARLLRLPSAISADTFAKGRVELLTLTVRDESPIRDMAIRDIFQKLKNKVLICSVERDGDVTIPTGNFVLRAGDTVGVLASSAQAAAFFREVGLLSNAARRVMIVGGGLISYYLAAELLALKMRVTIVEQNEDTALHLAETLPGAVIIHGDGTDRDLLFSEGLSDMDALCCFTGIDEENVLLALYARRAVDGLKTITKVTRVTSEELLKQLDVGSVIYPRYISADIISQYVRALGNTVGNNVETLYRIFDNKVEALEFHVGEQCPIVGIPFSKLSLRKNVLIGCINRGGDIIIPGGSDSLMVGDSVIVVTTESGLGDLHDILESGV